MGTYQTQIDGVIAAITADTGVAVAAGISIMAVTLAARVGIRLVKSFISSSI